MKLQLLLVAACLCAASAGGVPKKLLKKYAMKKIMESCFGEEVLDRMKAEVMAACDKCHGEAGPEMPQLRAQLVDMFQPTMAGYRSSVQYVPVPISYQPVPYGYGPHRRYKRSHHGVTAEKIEEMQMKIKAKIGNITCVLREMKMLDSGNQVDYASIKKRVMALPAPKTLIDDMCEAMDHCRDFASCIPSQVFEKSPGLSGFGKQMAFFKCFKKVKLEVCMKQEFREEYYPMLAQEGINMDEDETFATIYTAAMLEEAGDM